MHTAGYVTQGKPNTDGQFFICASDAFIYASNIGGEGSATLALDQVGNGAEAPAIQIAAGLSFGIGFDLNTIITRLGMLQSQNFATNSSQQAFGTAEGPGPNATSGTSSPAGFGANSVIPPVTTANLPTLIGSVSGPPKKGVQVNYIDLLYANRADVGRAVNVALQGVQFPLGLGVQATFDTNNLSYDLTSDQLAITPDQHCNRLRIPNTNPFMLTNDGDLLTVIVSGQTGVGENSLSVFGIIVGISYNYN
jgi:hypothetical protein